MKSAEPGVVKRRMDALASARQRYTNLIRERAHLRSDRLVRALAEVPRENYLGSGPWKILPSHLGEYIDTPDADPIQVYGDVLVALDPMRSLNNGLPSGVCAWIDALDLQEGERVVHCGSGTGYYTALMAEVVGEKGKVVAIEYDARSWILFLDPRAERANLNCSRVGRVQARALWWN